MDFSLLTQLVQTPGIPGREEQVQKLVVGQMKKLKADISFDNMGNVIGHLPGKGPKVAVMAHMDEVGFLVSKIDTGGFIRVMPMGGVDPRVFGAQQVVVHGAKDLPGIVGSIPPHLLKNEDPTCKAALPIEESFIDVGLPEDEVKALVNIGDPVTFAATCWENETSFFGKALDDRVGLFIMLMAAKQAAKIDCDLYLMATVQEEYGLRGASPAVFPVTPQIAIALEGTAATDVPGLNLPSNITPTVQGGGPEIKLNDIRMVSNRKLVDFIVQTAQKAKISHQVVAKNTGATDAAAAQVTAGGAMVLALSVPSRYIHAPLGVARKSDIVNAVDLMAAFLARASEFPM